MGFLALPLMLPESSETRGGAEFPGLRLLILGYGHGLVETGFSWQSGCRKTVEEEVHLAGDGGQLRTTRSHHSCLPEPMLV